MKGKSKFFCRAQDIKSEKYKDIVGMTLAAPETWDKNPMGLHTPGFALIQGLIKFFNFRVDGMSNAVYISRPVTVFLTSGYYIFRDRHNK